MSEKNVRNEILDTLKRIAELKVLENQELDLLNRQVEELLND